LAGASPPALPVLKSRQARLWTRLYTTFRVLGVSIQVSLRYNGEADQHKLAVVTGVIGAVEQAKI